MKRISEFFQLTVDGLFFENSHEIGGRELVWCQVMGSKYPNSHWDYNSRWCPSSLWQNIPHGGLPPVKS
jgi:hypothetical protein